MSGTIREDGAPVRFIAHYWRHYQEYRDPEDDLREAVALLVYGADDGQLAPVAVETEDGTVLVTAEQVSELASRSGDADFDLDTELFRLRREVEAGPR